MKSEFSASLRRMFSLLLACILVSLLVACGGDEETPPAKETVASVPADLLLRNGYVYTADAQHSIAQAVAVREGNIVAVGSDADLQSLQGPETKVIDLAGRMMLPGLHDVHLHIFGIVEPDVCSFESEPMSLDDMVPFLQECIQRYQLPPGAWLTVDMWNFSQGNQVSHEFPSLRAALDAVSTEHPVLLWGNDGHHGAVNSRALEAARDPTGNVIGFSAETLAGPFKDLREVVGVDENGEPNGELNEQARYLLGVGPRRQPDKLGPLLPDIGRVLASNGITSVRDASLAPAFLPYLEQFEQSGDMRFRIQVANRLEPENYQDSLTGQINIDQMMADVEAARTRFAGHPLVRADAVKIYADGVLEGNPYADPPSLPNGAVIEAYKQPRFSYDVDSGELSIKGYVDTASPVCVETREQMERYAEKAARDAYRLEHGFFPSQCTISYGVLSDPEPFMMEYVRRLDAAGFNIHIHAIGDRAVRLATDALEQVTPLDGSNPLRHGMAHLQLVHPDDQKRIGAMGLYMAWTYAWMLINPEYDMTVMPFIGQVTGTDDIYDPASYRMQNSYPVRTLMAAGAVTAAGSDAPVEDRSPRPFINMALGVTRQGRDGRVLNADQTIDIHQMIAAYTINGARSLHQENQTGTIEVGKKADFAVLDRNIVDLYEGGNGYGIAETKVDLTLFDGEVVYERNADTSKP